VRASAGIDALTTNTFKAPWQYGLTTKTLNHIDCEQRLGIASSRDRSCKGRASSPLW